MPQQYTAHDAPILHERLPACLAAARHKRLDFLRTRTRRHHERVRNVHNYKIVHAETGN